MATLLVSQLNPAAWLTVKVAELMLADKTQQLDSTYMLLETVCFLVERMMELAGQPQDQQMGTM